MAGATRSSGTDDTIPASDLDDAEPTAAPLAEQRYRLGEEIGRGGMGRVVEAYDTHLGRTVALKEVLPDTSPSLAKRFQREVRITARLEHASIVPLYDAGLMADGRAFYVMRRVTGRPLDELILRAKNLEERLALLPNVLAAIDAVGHAHRRGVIHRDIKPANILVGDLGETVVIDWGLAKVVGEEEPPPPSFEPFVPTAGDSLKTHVGSVFGTPGFMAPEQARGDELDPRSDVYALGATLYQLLAGRPPISGSSATEMIASTATKSVVPIAKASPTAPPELATIIDKALSFAANERYPDGAALAEDVRRFLTGQLVAAHRYTRRQRIARFARKHRAALVVAAAAATAVAVLSWVSVHRILKERDTATRAQREAEQQRTLAVTAADEARQRADQLLLAHARGLLDTSPTEAIAVLEHLKSSAPDTVAQARAIAKAAVARGVAWGLQSLPGPTTSFEMTRDGSRLLQVNREGQLQIIDLSLRKQIKVYAIGSGSGAMWVDGDRKILLDRYKESPALYDPATGALDPIAASELSEIARTSDGKLVAFIDKDRHAGFIDIATRNVTMVWNGTAERTIAIAEDGSWLAFGDRIDAKRARLVVTDRTGKVLLARPGSATITAVSAGGKLAASLYEEVVEIRPADPAPTFTKIPLEPKEAMLIHQLVYRDEHVSLVGGRSIVTWAYGRVLRSDAISDTAYFANPTPNDVMVVTASDSNVHLLRDATHFKLPLTEPPDGMYRVASARGSSRVAATTKGAILLWDTATLFPRVSTVPPGLFISNRRVLASKGMGPTWELWDVDTDKRVPIDIELEGVPMGYQVLVEESRVLAKLGTPRGNVLVLIHGDGTHEVVLRDAGEGIARLVPGNGVIYSNGKNRIFGKLDKQAARELASLDGDVVSLTADGKLGYIALGATGEVVRGTFGGSGFARTRIADLDKSAFVVGDGKGSAFIGAGNRLLRWRGDVHELARFAVAIDFIAATEVGLYVKLVNEDVLFIPPAGNQTPQRVPVSKLAAISNDGALVVGLSASWQVELVDMPALASWTLPRWLGMRSNLAASADGQRLLQSVGLQVGVWRIDQPGSDFAAWLAEQTNAREDEGHVRWPWQP
ncbi:MAG TPA: serine/threonine-protein kinase [Kofleriaceae bacterium]